VIKQASQAISPYIIYKISLSTGLYLKIITYGGWHGPEFKPQGAKKKKSLL
jgi:hypothetical protein